METWGLVLAGGGAKGAYQIGAWKALLEYGYMEKVSAVSGASIGAINALLMAGSNYHDAREAWDKIDWLTVFAPSLSLLDGEEGSFSREELIDILDEVVDYKQAASGTRTLWVGVTRMIAQSEALAEGLGDTYKKSNMEAVYLDMTGRSKEEIEQYVLASSALPIVYESVTIEGNVYRDGGLTDNLPAAPLYESGFRNFIYILLNDKTKIPNYDDVTALVICPSKPLGDLLEGTLNFDEEKIDYLFELGYRDAMTAIRAFREKNPQKKEGIQIAGKQNSHQAKIDMKKKMLEESVQREFDKIQSYMDKYQI